jgi:DNA polymerase III alpha subunit (gram-positive type)
MMNKRPLIFLDIECSALRPGWRGEFYGELLEVAIIIDYQDHIEERVWRMEPENMELHDPEALKINRYDQRMNNYNLTPWSLVIEDIHKALTDTGGYIVGHNVQFDIHYLNFYLKQTHLRAVPLRVIDTMTLAHEHLTPLGLRGLGFDRIRSFMGWKLDGHNALKDVRDTRKLYYKLRRASIFQRLFWRIRRYVYKLFTL